MAGCEKNLLDSASISAAQPGANDVVLFTRPDGTSYLQKWSVMLTWIQAALGGSTPPTAAAGADQSITLPTNSVTLVSTGSSGGSGTITGYLWTKIAGPSGGTITSPTASSTTVTGLTQGTHTFRLTVTNSNSQTAQDDVNITVNASAPATFTASWAALASDPYTALQTSDTITYDGSGSFALGANIVANFGSVANRWYVLKYPATETDKTHYVNTAVFIEGDIPDSVFRAVFAMGGNKYIVSRTPQTFDPNPTTFS